MSQSQISLTHIDDIVNLVSDDSPPRISAFEKSRSLVISLEKRVMDNNARIASMELEIEYLKTKSINCDIQIRNLQESIAVLNAKIPARQWTKDEFDAFVEQKADDPMLEPPKLTRLRSGSLVRPSPTFDIAPRLPPPPPSPIKQLAPKRLNFGPPRQSAAQATAHQLNSSAPHLVFPLNSPNRARFIRTSLSSERSFIVGLNEDIEEFND